MIKLALGLGPYAEDLSDCEVLPAVARMTEFCAGFLAEDKGRAGQTHRFPSDLDVLA